jgi:D-amino-acid dehydrogenase
MKALRADTRIAYEGRQKGTLQVFRNHKQLEAAQQDVRILSSLGIAHELIDARASGEGHGRLLSLEPGLFGTVGDLSGALYLPGDETGDCFQFTQSLAALCLRQGVKFRYGVSVDKLVREGDRVSAVWVDGKPEVADKIVMAMGSYSREQLHGLGLKIPVYPLKGYSLTVPILDKARAPVSTVMDETYKVAVTRFDDRIRVGGMAEVAGFDMSLNLRRRKTLEHVLEGLFPGAGHLAEAQFWTGLRPMTPDGTPIVGATALKNLWLNTGHGTLGWTMACGSAQLLADLMTGTRPKISPVGLDIRRYQDTRETEGFKRRKPGPLITRPESYS